MRARPGRARLSRSEIGTVLERGGRRPRGCRPHALAPVASKAKRGFVECDLIVAADLVRDLLPGLRDRVRTFLRGHLARKDLGKLILRDAVILENAGNARFDRRVRVIVGIRLGSKVIRDERLIISGANPFLDVELALAVALEAGRISCRPKG